MYNYIIYNKNGCEKRADAMHSIHCRNSFMLLLTPSPSPFSLFTTYNKNCNLPINWCRARRATFPPVRYANKHRRTFWNDSKMSSCQHQYCPRWTRWMVPFLVYKISAIHFWPFFVSLLLYNNILSILMKLIVQ